MKRIVSHALFILSFSCVAAFAMGARPESADEPGIGEAAETITRQASDRDETWKRRFSESLITAFQGADLSSQSAALTARYLAGLELPEDPEQAAAVFLEASREADIALRRGEPPNRIGLETRRIWKERIGTDIASPPERSRLLERGRNTAGHENAARNRIQEKVRSRDTNPNDGGPPGEGLPDGQEPDHPDGGGNRPEGS